MKIVGTIKAINLTGAGLSSVQLRVGDDEKPQQVVVSVPHEIAAGLAPLMLKTVTLTIEEAKVP